MQAQKYCVSMLIGTKKKKEDLIRRGVNRKIFLKIRRGVKPLSRINRTNRAETQASASRVTSAPTTDIAWKAGIAATIKFLDQQWPAARPPEIYTTPTTQPWAAIGMGKGHCPPLEKLKSYRVKKLHLRS